MSGIGASSDACIITHYSPKKRNNCAPEALCQEPCIEKHLELEPGKKVRVGKKSLGEEELDALIAKRNAEVEKLETRLSPLPKKVTLDTVLAPEKIVKLERERKVLVDAIKLTAYRAEGVLTRMVEPFFKRYEDEGRKFLKSIFQATADIVPDAGKRQLTVRFHGLASPRATRALGELCVIMTERETLYPGTDLRLRFEAPRLQKQRGPCQEPCTPRARGAG